MTKADDIVLEEKPLDHYDVTGRVHISDPVAVRDAVIEILSARFRDLNPAAISDGFLTFTRLYAGELPGYVGCDTWYHDAQHSLDCTLAMARLLDGHQRSVPVGEALGWRRAVLGVIIALFHDAGYIRRAGDTAANGSEFTIGHVRRSGEFLRDYLPKVGFANEVDLAAQIVHFTGYEIALDSIAVTARKDRLLGFLLGTADILSQCADLCYLEKCRDYLFREFSICGLAGRAIPGGPQPIYTDPEDLLRKTPAFHEKVRHERLDGYFEGVHRYMAEHFDGENPYTRAIDGHLEHIGTLVRSGRLDQLRQKPQVIGAEAMRAALRNPAFSAGPKPARATA